MALTKFKRNGLALAGIAAIAGSLALAFAWTAGLIGQRSTSKNFLGASLHDFEPGYRRAHGKGMCFAGTFKSSGAAAALSSARVFAQGEVPALGRFSLGSGDPHAADSSTATVGMALMLTTADHAQWRMKMNNIPYFPTRDAQGFLAMRAATAPDPATGKPDPARLAAFLQEYPEAAKDLQRRATAPQPASFAGVEYNAVNAFILINAQGERQAVRWRMRPHAAFSALSTQQREQVGHDFMFAELGQRVAEAPLYWDLLLQLAEPGDPVDDPSQPWPAERKDVVAGTLTLTQVFDQRSGECRDINFDPTLVPPGIALSNDPVLAARAGIYAQSYNARLREVGFGKATEAVGKPEAQP